MNDDENEEILILPNIWREIQPDTIYQTADGGQVSFGKEQIQLGITYDQDGKPIRSIEKGRVPPKGNNGLVSSQKAGYDLKSKVLGKGGDYRFHGKIIDEVIHFPGKITDH